MAENKCFICGGPIGQSKYTKDGKPVCSQACASANSKDARRDKMTKSESIIKLITEIMDQYGEQVPDDLVVLPDPQMLGEDEIKKVMDAPWYEAEGILMASAKAIDGLSEFDPKDAGIDLEETEVSAIDDPLKRYSKEDGFYHA